MGKSFPPQVVTISKTHKPTFLEKQEINLYKFARVKMIHLQDMMMFQNNIEWNMHFFYIKIATKKDNSLLRISSLNNTLFDAHVGEKVQNVEHQ